MKKLFQHCAFSALNAGVLKKLIQECYYSKMIAAPRGAGNAVIDTLTSEVLEIEQFCAKRERYDLAATCRDANIDIAMQRVLPMF